MSSQSPSVTGLEAARPKTFAKRQKVPKNQTYLD
jgi:hypothetical protein